MRDLEVADRIARALRSGRPADRRHTPEQLLSAFGEPERRPMARRRATLTAGPTGVQITRRGG